MPELAQRIRDLMVAGDQYRQAVAAALRVGVPEAVTLGHVYHAGQLTPTAIAERLGMTTASVTGLLDRLSASGYLTRNPNPRDRRSILVTLTDDGLLALRALSDLFAADLEAATADAGPAELASLERLLQQAGAALRHRAREPIRLAALLAAAERGGPADSAEPAGTTDGSDI
ncbi:MAG TPA: MarR family transcriptional regulator [Pseudonocardiaceae bacterium]|jgi:DNA-binding MarR family transcriptional regulator